MLKVVVGSTSEHKLLAVREALLELKIEADIVGVKARSGVPEQPDGFGQILAGATHRAIDAQAVTDVSPDLRALYIGIENGVFSAKSNTHAIVSDLAVVVVLAHESKSGGRFYFANSAGHPVNYIDTEEARRRGFDRHTVASVTAERTGCDATDATPHYTGGRMNRVELLKGAVKLALAQWLGGGQ